MLSKSLLRGRKGRTEGGREQGRSDQAQLEVGMVFKGFDNQHSIGTDQSEWTLAVHTVEGMTWRPLWVNQELPLPLES